MSNRYLSIRSLSNRTRIENKRPILHTSAHRHLLENADEDDSYRLDNA